ncbi:hypothetical protein GCM10009634_43020 [Saccharothrix xinjiangensis]
MRERSVFPVGQVSREEHFQASFEHGPIVHVARALRDAPVNDLWAGGPVLRSKRFPGPAPGATDNADPLATGSFHQGESHPLG